MYDLIDGHWSQTNDEIFERLKTELPWIRLEGSKRTECWMNDYPATYVYGSGKGVRTYDSNPIPDIIRDIRASLPDYAPSGYRIGYLQACFANWYLDEEDGLGWHADDSDSIDQTYPILSVSFGAVRDINVKPIGGKGVDCISRFTLGNGSIFCMPPGSQQTHQHRIPHPGKKCKDRISLTFRRLK